MLPSHLNQQLKSILCYDWDNMYYPIIFCENENKEHIMLCTWNNA